MKTLNILFVCKYNRFRSKIAEAYFKKINKNKKIKISSAGLFEGFPMSKKTIKIVRRFGIKMKGKPRAMSNKLINEQDLIVVIANDVPKWIFNKQYVKKMIKWRIKDTPDGNKKKIIKISEQIIRKINKLNKKLERKIRRWKPSIFYLYVSIIDSEAS